MIDPKNLASNHRWHTEKDWTQKKRNLTRAANSVHATVSCDLELSLDEQRTLIAAHAILERGCAIYGKTASIAKKSAAERSNRLEKAKSIVQRKFGELQSTSDRVALMASALSHTFDLTSPCVEGLTESKDKRYYAKRIRDEMFEDALETVAYRIADQISDQNAPLEKKLEEIWNRFLELKPGLIQRHALLIAQVDEALATPAPTGGL